MKENGTLFATFFEVPEGQPSREPRLHHPGEITTYPARDPYHYKLTDFIWLAGQLGWNVERAPDFSHPRDQQMLKFTRTGPSES